MRTNVKFDHADFYTILQPYQEKEMGEVDYVVQDILVNFATIQQPDLPRPIEGTFRLYENRVEMKVCGYPPVKALLVKRGMVSFNFSRKSRRRMMSAFHSWQVPEGYKRYHITLTYPKEYPDNWQDWKLDLKAIKRRFAAIFPDIQGYWRLELQPKRQAPHYHLFVAIPKGIVTNKKLKKIVTREWAKIAHKTDQYGGKYATKVQPIFNDAMAFIYISKYCAKFTPQEKPMETYEGGSLGEQFDRGVSDYLQRIDKEKTIGRQWGRIGQPNESPIAEMKCSVQHQDLIKSVLGMWLESIGSSFADRVKHALDYMSYQVYGMKGHAFALISPDLFLRTLYE